MILKFSSEGAALKDREEFVHCRQGCSTRRPRFLNGVSAKRKFALQRNRGRNESNSL